MAPSSATTKAAAQKKKARFRARQLATQKQIAHEKEGCGDNAKHASYQTRKKARTKAEKAEMEAVARFCNSKNIRTELPALPVHEFASFDAFFDHMTDHCVDTSASFTIRSSNKADWKNDKLIQAHEAAKAAAARKNVDFKQELHLIPGELEYYSKKYVCVHATYHPDSVPADERVRYPAHTRYTGCQARVTAEAHRVLRDGEWTWRVLVRQEHSVHNHICSPAIFDSYYTESRIDDTILLAQIATQIDVDGNSRIMLDNISTALGAPYTAKQLQNLKSYHLLGGAPNDNLEDYVDDFLSVDGNRVYVVHDQHGNIVGIIFQTAIQRELHEYYGDNLLLDWTHNSNNIGMYLGCLMATSATGKGIPVLDFLCMTQSVDMMRIVLEVFIEDSQAAVDIVESFVIDKDYKEWKAVSTVFADASVVLCQFHVLKWFKTVVAEARHEIPPAQRSQVLKLVRRMVYAESRDEFLRSKSSLLSLLPAETHPTFQDYMEMRWFACESMWANHARGKIFTAGNTTTNRLESHWNQLKALLGKHRRIDRCIEAVFRRQTTVLKRELDEIVRATATTRLFPNDNDFTRPLLQDLSESRGLIVKRQWTKYLARSNGYSCPNGLSEDGSCIVLPSSTSGARFVVQTASKSHWTCSCRFSTSHKLPCRH